MDYDEIQLLVYLETKVEEREQTCFDHVNSISHEDELWKVEVFVEPSGVILHQHRDLSQLLRFFIAVFESQPSNWGFAKAGRHLGEHLPMFKWSEPEDAPKVWVAPDNC